MDVLNPFYKWAHIASVELWRSENEISLTSEPLSGQQLSPPSPLVCSGSQAPS